MTKVASFFRLLIRCFVLLCLGSTSAWAMKAAHWGSTDMGEQWMRFFCFEDTAVRYALIGALLMGLSTGVLGSFLVVRRLAMMGDTLSHAVLPGLVGGFLWAGGKEPWALFTGALLAGLLGVWLVSQIKTMSVLKEDAALGLVLSGFYAIGVCLLTMVQHMEIGQKSGLDKILFGQAAALGLNDLYFMGGVTAVVVILVGFFYKEFLALSFDEAFARALGWPIGLFQGLFMGVLAATVVVSLQASGVVLVSAMLIIPASAAYLLTQRFGVLVILASTLSMIAGVLGALLSFLKPGIPTGPCMVACASLEFGLIWLLAPGQGIIPQWVRQMRVQERIALENTLKAIYHVLEKGGFQLETVTLEALAEGQALVARGFAHFGSLDKAASIENRTLHLTPQGWARACEIVRNHRLWELYLTHAANYAPDHVHEDAEKIEHMLGETIVRQLETRLNYPQRDPHGKLIPSLADMENPYFSRPPWGNKPRSTEGYGASTIDS